MENNKMKIFIGSSTEAIPVMEKIAVILESIDFIVKCWNDNESFVIGKTISENLTNILKEVDVAIFIYSDDDKTWYKDRVIGSPRDNVLFEHGFFAGKLGLSKSIIIRHNTPKVPSDLAGIIYAEYNSLRLNTLKDKLRIWKNGLEKDTLKLSVLDSFGNPEYNEGKPNIFERKFSTKDDFENDQFIKDTSKDTIQTTSAPFIKLVSMIKGTYNRIKDNQRISIDYSYAISKNLITQSIYYSITGDNPSHFKGDDLPVENVTYFDAIKFCNKLSIENGFSEVYKIENEIVSHYKDITGYRLPFEIEWEYALGYDIEEISDKLNELAWYNGNSDYKTHVIEQKEKNRFGIYDLLGNVWEWCFDSYEDSPPQTPVLENVNKLKVLRGGSFADFKNMFSMEKVFRKKENASTKNRFNGFRIVLQKY